MCPSGDDDGAWGVGVVHWLFVVLARGEKEERRGEERREGCCVGRERCPSICMLHSVVRGAASECFVVCVEKSFYDDVRCTMVVYVGFDGIEDDL